MRAGAFFVVVALGVFVDALSARSALGTWQGTLAIRGQSFRVVIEINRTRDGAWKAIVHSPDQTTERLGTESITFAKDSLRIDLDQISSLYRGRLSADGESLVGEWTGREPEFLGTAGASQSLTLRTAGSISPLTIDPTPHRVRFIKVQKYVQLEVLDYGGTGRPLLLITGSGNTAHKFDPFAVRLAEHYRVYAVTRRGFGSSDWPKATPENYSADRLGDDVLAVIAALKIDRPVLVGHSMGGEELSSIASRFPEKVCGLIYLEAAYRWAYLEGPEAGLLRPARPTQSLSVPMAMALGMKKYTRIFPPTLAVYAIPKDRGISDPIARAAAEAKDLKEVGAAIDSFQRGVPNAQIVRIPHARHYIFESHPDQVLAAIDRFLSGLP